MVNGRAMMTKSYTGFRYKAMDRRDIELKKLLVPQRSTHRRKERSQWRLIQQYSHQQ